MVSKQKRKRCLGALGLGADTNDFIFGDAGLHKILEKLVKGVVGVANDEDAQTGVEKEIGDLGADEGLSSALWQSV